MRAPAVLQDPWHDPLMGLAPAYEIVFEAFGVRACVAAATPDALDVVLPALPPGWRPSEGAPPSFRFELVPAGADHVRVEKDGVSLSAPLPLEIARMTIERELRIEVALRAPGMIFVHAGAVAHCGRGLILPGTTFAGKTTLVTALVRAGATYLSDEYAVLDLDGNVRSYARAPSVRVDGVVHERRDLEETSGSDREATVPVGAIAFATYRDGANWRPERLSPGDAVLALLEHTVAAQTRPAESLRAVRQAVDGAVLVRGERGDVDAVAASLLALLDARQTD